MFIHCTSRDKIFPLPFRCKFCPKRFCSLDGSDAHCDSAHAELNTFACPNDACTQCFPAKPALFYHLEYICGDSGKGGRGNNGVGVGPSRVDARGVPQAAAIVMLRAQMRREQLRREQGRSRQVRLKKSTLAAIAAAQQEEAKGKKKNKAKKKGEAATEAAAAANGNQQQPQQQKGSPVKRPPNYSWTGVQLQQMRQQRQGSHQSLLKQRRKSSGVPAASASPSSSSGAASSSIPVREIKTEPRELDEATASAAAAAIVDEEWSSASPSASTSAASPSMRVKKVKDLDVDMIKDTAAEGEGVEGGGRPSRGVKRKTEELEGAEGEVDGEEEAVQYEDRRQSDHSERNIAKRRQRHPQVRSLDGAAVAAGAVAGTIATAVDVMFLLVLLLLLLLLLLLCYYFYCCFCCCCSNLL